PIMVLLATTFILKERLTKVKMLGILLGFIGAVMLVTGGGFSFSGDTFVGDIFILINALAYGVYLVIAKPMLNKYKPLTVVKWIFTFGCLFVIPMGYPELREVEWSALPNYAYVALVYIIIFTTCLAYLLNAFALKKASPNIVGYYIYLQPIIATTIAVLFRGDSLTLPTILFSCLIFIGVYLVSIKRKVILSES
ncbi:MAG: DMT family transporter, partial [Saprospiraceae bacterium]